MPDLDEVPACPVHQGSSVSRAGTAWRKGGQVRRWKCRPTGDRVHLFVASATARKRLVSPVGVVIACPAHPEARVQRHGRVVKAGVERERFRCFPDGGVRHTFSVPVALIPGDTARLSPAMGEQLVASRRARMGSRTPHTPQEVALTLLRLGAGMTYRQASSLIRPDERPNAQSSWRLAADWCEMFSPLVTAGRLPHRWPDEVFVGWVPLAAPSRDGEPSWGLLAVAERTGPQSGRLVAVSAAPEGDQAAWEDLFSRLEGRPSYIVGDDDSAARAAMASVWGSTPTAPQWVSSHWHLRRKLRTLIRRMSRTDMSAEVLTPLIEGSLASVAEWGEFRLAVHRTVPGSLLDEFVSGCYDDVAAQLADLSKRPDALRTSAPIEPLTAAIRSVLAPRRGRLANQERTQRLLDLMLAHHLKKDDPEAYEAVLVEAASDPTRWMPRRALSGMAGLRAQASSAVESLASRRPSAGPVVAAVAGVAMVVGVHAMSWVSSPACSAAMDCLAA